MSGTSLDGLDIAHCSFVRRGACWEYAILQAETMAYSDEWIERLSVVENFSALEFVKTDIEYGHLLGQFTNGFIRKHKLTPDLIASHGHTVFHQPDQRITSQIGRGSAIAAETGYPVVCDFRSLDVALGGQGAPLVPIGDKLLFPDYDYCLNLGGFANISTDTEGGRIAFDLCPANIVLNRLAAATGANYDYNGDMARSGTAIPELLHQLNTLPFYRQPGPKSLGKEWVISTIIPLLKGHKKPFPDLLATFCEHIALQVGAVMGRDPEKKMLVTGGGALNGFLVERIRHHVKPTVIIPDILTINFKEALVFAFLGLLRWRNENNCLRSVTGAACDNCGGAIYQGIRKH